MNRNKKNSKLVVTLILSLVINLSMLAAVRPVHAQGKWAKYFRRLEGESIPYLAGSTLGQVLNQLWRYIFPLAGLLLLLYLVYGGYELMLSRGDPKAIESGRKKITYAILGFFIVFISYWLVQIIGRILGVGVIANIFYR